MCFAQGAIRNYLRFRVAMPDFGVRYLLITTSSATAAPRYARRVRNQNVKIKMKNYWVAFGDTSILIFDIYILNLGRSERSEVRPFDLHALSTPPAFILS